MEWWVILIITGVLLMSFFLSGLEVAFAFFLFNIIATLIWMGPQGLGLLAKTIFPSIGCFAMVAVPMFIFMGELMFRTGIATVMIDGIAVWIGRIRGSLSLIAVAAGTLFGTMSGASMSSVAVLGSTLVPEMRKQGYSKEMSIGPILGAGGLAMIVPPTILGIILANLAKLSVGKFLIACIFPGLVMGGMYTAYIIGRAYLQPHLAPHYAPPDVTWSKRLRALVSILPLTLLIFLVLGVVFIGVATPTEAAALGVSGAFILAFAYRRLNWETVKESVLETVKVTSMMLLIIAGSLTFSQILAYTGAAAALVNMASNLSVSPILVVIAMQCMLLLLGTFIDGISMMMITVPLYFPVIMAMGFDPYWFAVIMLVNIEMGTTSPPFGVLLFVMKGLIPDASMKDIYLAGIPFILCDICSIAIFMIFPIVVLWLPSMM